MGALAQNMEQLL